MHSTQIIGRGCVQKGFIRRYLNHIFLLEIVGGYLQTILLCKGLPGEDSVGYTTVCRQNMFFLM